MSLIVGQSLADTFLKRVDVSPSRSALLRKRQGVWGALSWIELEQRVFRLAQALSAEGVRAGDRIALLSQNRPEWAMVDFAILSLGAVTVPIYPSLTADDVDFILKDCGARFLFIDDSVQRAKVESLLSSGLQGRRVISFDPVPPGTHAESLESWLSRTLVSEESLGSARHQQWREEARSVQGQAVATIVYTSGTEGVPKGVELTHSNFLRVMESAAAAVTIGEKDLTLLFLPMAHIMGRLEQMLSLGVGWTNAYPERPSKLMENLAEVRPTILFGVPRVYEKIRDGVLLALRDSSAGPLANWRSRALRHGLHYGIRLQQKGQASRWSRWQWALLDVWIFERLRSQFGGRLRLAISGGAPLSIEVGEFFRGCGLPLLEGYGLTETTGPVCLNLPQNSELGTVGRPLPGVEIRVASDGEIFLRGPMLFPRYHGEKESKLPFDSEGWFATGDVGLIDGRGFLRITDRKKDLIINSGGKNIAPARVEAVFRSSPLISQLLVVGDRRSYLTGLFTLNLEATRAFCNEQGIAFVSLSDLVANSVFQRAFSQIVEDLNARLASYERIRRYQILSRDFSIEAGELTPSHKVRRTECTRKYAHLIEELYR